MPIDSLDSFEQSATQLKESLGAEDFLELDLVHLAARTGRRSGPQPAESSRDSPLAALLHKLVPEPSEADAGPLHLVVKWSARLRPDTVELHIEVAEQAGAVWWGLASQDIGWRVSEKVVDTLRRQIDAGESTFVYISGPTYWQANLLDIQYGRDNVDEELVPRYYSEVPRDYHLWVKLSSFVPTDRDTLLRDLDPETRRGKPVALGNQTNPLFVRKRVAPPLLVGESRIKLFPRARGRIRLGSVTRQGREAERALEHDGSPAGRRHRFQLCQREGACRQQCGDRGTTVRATRPNRRSSLVQRRPTRRTRLQPSPEPVTLTEIPLEWRMREGGPFRKDGAVNQGYLFPLSDDFVRRLANGITNALPDTKPEPEVIAKRDPYVEPPLPEIAAALKASASALATTSCAATT